MQVAKLAYGVTVRIYSALTGFTGLSVFSDVLSMWCFRQVNNTPCKTF